MAMMIKVYPAPGGVQINHPSGGPMRAKGSMWPADVFTHRRIADGTILRAPAGDLGEARKAVVDKIAQQFNPSPPEGRRR